MSLDSHRCWAGDRRKQGYTGPPSARPIGHQPTCGDRVCGNAGVVGSEFFERSNSGLESTGSIRQRLVIGHSPTADGGISAKDVAINAHGILVTPSGRKLACLV